MLLPRQTEETAQPTSCESESDRVTRIWVEHDDERTLEDALEPTTVALAVTGLTSG